MIGLALRNLWRRPLRTLLTLGGLSVAVAVLACLLAFGEGYRRNLHSEIDRMGMQLMLVPLGCPYDAAARVLKGKVLENSLPQSALDAALKDPAVAVAAPMLIAAVPREKEKRTDIWVGLDEAALSLKPWWKEKSGARWFAADDSVILGSEAAAVEMRAPGDKFYSPETAQQFHVAGVLERSGTSDDSAFFIPLRTAQKMFNQSQRITAIAIRLRDPALINEAAARLQNIPGAQVVTLTEMMGTFLNLVGSVRTLVFAIAVIAMVVSALTVFNTLLGAVVERTPEFSLMRAIGASRAQVFTLITAESVALTSISAGIGVVLAFVAGSALEMVVKQFVPLAPAESLLSLNVSIVLQCVVTAVVVGVVAAVYPSWQASRLHPAEALKIE